MQIIARCAQIVLMCGLMVPNTLKADEHPRGIVTFTVDNILLDFYENRWPEFIERDIPGTLFGQTQPIGDKPWDMDWDQVRAVIDAGWEFGAHSYSHQRFLSEVDGDYVELELGAPAAHIYRETDVYPVTFASPFGDYDESVLERVRVYYDAHFGAWGNDGFNPFDATDHYRINRIEIGYTDTVNAVCDAMAMAGKRREWLVFMLHGITDEDTASEYSITHDTLTRVLECAADFRSKGVIDIMRAKDALEVVPHTPR